jgi:outer membrane immunogenic protein
VAADIPVRASRAAPAAVAVPAAAPFSWTGCYIGLNAGVGIAESDWDLRGTPPASLGSDDATGAVVGGQVGCDLQTGNFVFGVEGLLDWADLNDSHVFRGVRFHSDANWFATVTGRAGVSFGPTVWYVRGGAAFIDNDHHLTAFGVRVNTRGEDTETGWTIGGGAEWAFAPNWSARLEYNYMDFGSDSPNFCAGGVCARLFNIDERVHTVTVGVNFRFR